MVKRHVAAAEIFHTYDTEIPSSAKCSGLAAAFQCFDWNSDISTLLCKTVQQVSGEKKITSTSFFLTAFVFEKNAFRFI